MMTDEERRRRIAELKVERDRCMDMVEEDREAELDLFYEHVDYELGLLTDVGESRVAHIARLLRSKFELERARGAPFLSDRDCRDLLRALQRAVRCELPRLLNQLT
jgi:hypothetical protein